MKKKCTYFFLLPLLACVRSDAVHVSFIKTALEGIMKKKKKIINNTKPHFLHMFALDVRSVDFFFQGKA